MRTLHLSWKVERRSLIDLGARKYYHHDKKNNCILLLLVNWLEICIIFHPNVEYWIFYWICRRSMDMFTGVTPPSLSFLRSSAMSSSAYMRSQSPTPQHSLCKPLISSPSFDREDVPTLNPSKLSVVSSARFSALELPPSQQCSYTQSVLNGKTRMLSCCLYIDGSLFYY